MGKLKANHPKTFLTIGDRSNVVNRFTSPLEEEILGDYETRWVEYNNEGTDVVVLSIEEPLRIERSLRENFFIHFCDS